MQSTLMNPAAPATAIDPVGAIAVPVLDIAADRAAPRPATSRLAYFDSLKVALTISVIVFHLAITYGAAGSWYYIEHRDDAVTNALLTWGVATFQFFFMGLFFLIAGYFTPASLERKGAKRFIVDRLLRLGLPLLVFDLTLSPLLEAASAATSGSGVSFWASWRASLFEFAPGPLWFVETLLIFSLAYVAWRAVRGRNATRLALDSLTTRTLVLFVAGVAAASFAVRLWYPIGAEWEHFQLAFFPQYVAMFAGGILLSRRRVLSRLPRALARVWAPVAAVAIIAIPVSLMLGGGVDGNIDAFGGGLHWQAATAILAEALIAAGVSISLIVLFRARFNAPGWLGRRMARVAYAAYIVHAPIDVGLAYAIRDFGLPPLVKLALVAPVAVSLTFAVSDLLVHRLPRASRIL